MSNYNTSLILAVGVAVIAVLAAVFVYRTTVVFGVGGDMNIDDGTLFVNSSDNRVGVRNKLPGFTLDVSGDVNTNTKIRESGFALIPYGTIVMWTGSTAPNGWALCDGTNGTPDLQGRFILSQGQGSGLTNRLINQVGGAETHTLTISEMPIHNHGYIDTFRSGNQNTDNAFATETAADDSFTNQFKATNNSVTGISINNTGGDQPHNNMPPYFVLAYIMKL